MSRLILLQPDERLRALARPLCDGEGLRYEEIQALPQVAAVAGRRALFLLPLALGSLADVAALRQQLPIVEIAALASQPSIPEAAEAIRAGALDYLVPPWTEAQLTTTLERWQARVTNKSETARLSEIITLMELGRTLTGTLQFGELFEQIIEQVARTFTPDTVSLMLLDEAGARLRLVAQRGLTATTGTEVSIEESIAGRVVREGRPQLLLGGLQGTSFARMARGRGTIGSAMSIPLIVKGETLGVLNVNRRKGRANYSEGDANLLHVFASQIAIALHNARLYESLREERDRIVRAQEMVRRELARDLHDGLGQVLATLAVNLDHVRSQLAKGKMPAERLEDELHFLRTVARQAVQDARTLTFGLRPLVLETQGLVAALEQYLAALGEGNKVRFHLSQECADISQLRTEVARMVFAILQEAINNARKHAQADNIWVHVACAPGESGARLLHASVRDDGIGFDMGAVEGEYEQRYSFGLLNMQERAELIDARFRMQSTPTGTEIHLAVPWRMAS